MESRLSSFLVNAGSVTLRKTGHQLSLAYDGAFPPDAHYYNLWLRYGWQF